MVNFIYERAQWLVWSQFRLVLIWRPLIEPALTPGGSLE